VTAFTGVGEESCGCHCARLSDLLCKVLAPRLRRFALDWE
jgi:hypothetical protein